MITLRIKTKEGHIQQIQVEELLSIDGKDFVVAPSVEERLAELENVVGSIVAFLHKPDPPEESSDASVRN